MRDRYSNPWTTLQAKYNGTTATGAGDQTLWTFTIPQGLMGTTRGVRFRLFFRRTTGTGNITVKTKFGGVRFDAIGATAGPAWVVEGEVWAAGSAAAQRGWVHLRSIAASTAISHAGQEASFSSNTDAAAGVALSVDVDFATDTDVATLYGSNVEIVE